MYKSALTFGLLISSIVMLVVMPFLNNNSFFSNVMAQEYDKYGDSSYSQYPTDDNKYQCRTGPFEGFFVSSVEFCKHVNFDKDDRKDNSTGNIKVRKVHKVHKVFKDHQAQKEVRQVLRVLRVLQEQQVQQVQYQVHKVKEVLTEHKVQLVQIR